MGEVTRYPNGTFCWIDLGTPDVEGARAFYSGLLGWDTEDLATGDGGSYTMCRLRGRNVAAFHEHRPEEGTGWSSYICADDLDATVGKAGELGATVLLEPFGVEGAGRVALIRDPAGAEVSLWQPGGHIGAGLVNEVGTWSWNELVAPDLEAARAFYGGLFGWQAQEVAAGIPRLGFRMGDLLIAGAHAPGQEEGDEPRWTVAFRVADADESAARAQELGGRVLLPPMDIAIGRFAIVADPGGASFTLAAVPGGAVGGVDGS